MMRRLRREGWIVGLLALFLLLLAVTRGIQPGYGGGDFASRADLASREEQITVANRVYADNGTSQWQCKP